MCQGYSSSCKTVESWGRSVHLSWLLSKAHDEGVAVRPAGGAIVEVLNDDCLLTSVAASQEDDHLLSLHDKLHRCVLLPTHVGRWAAAERVHMQWRKLGPALDNGPRPTSNAY